MPVARRYGTGMPTHGGQFASRWPELELVGQGFPGTKTGRGNRRRIFC